MLVTANWRGRIRITSLGIAALACSPQPADARGLSRTERLLNQLRRDLAAQRRLIDDQTVRIAEQKHDLERLQDQMALAARPSDEKRQRSTAPTSPNLTSATSTQAPNRPVGVAPDPAGVEEQAQAIPQGMGVLTHSGRVVLEPSLEYTNSSNNRLVFRGIELIPGIQIGLIDANTADRDTMVGAATVRYGLSDNLEVEARLPYLIRSDRMEGIQQQQDTTTQTFHLQESGIGDVELGLRYQLNRPVGERPIFIGSFRVKTDTGKGPFSVPFDQSGVATGLATGSGFWAVQPGLSFLLPSEPAVIFGGVSYLYNIPRNINRKVGDALIGRVDPGDAISGNIGFGFALNQRFSFSLAYEHNYIFPMRWKINGAMSRSGRLQVGALALGMSYRIDRRQTLNLGIQVGATEAAPDLDIVLRMPFWTD